MFCAPGHVFRLYRGRRVPFSCFARPDSFRRYRACPVPFSCFALPDMFLAVPRASGCDFMFCSARLVFGGTEGVSSRFHILCSWTRVRLYRGLRVLFSCFVRLNSFSAFPRASGPVLIFHAPGLIFGVTEGIRSRFHFLRARTYFRAVPSASGHVLMFCAPGHVFGSTAGIGSRFHVLLAKTLFRGYRGRRVPFSCFARPDSFSAVPSVSGPVFMFCASEHVFGSTAGIGSRFHVLLAQTRFRLYRGRQLPFSCFMLLDLGSTVSGVSAPVFHVLCAYTHFWRYRGCWVPFSCFARPDSFSAIPRALGLILMFCAPGLIFGGTEGVRSRFHVLRVETHFRRSRKRRVPFSSFTRPDSF
jgi:hypothetical protein